MKFSDEIIEKAYDAIVDAIWECESEGKPYRRPDWDALGIDDIEYRDDDGDWGLSREFIAAVNPPESDT